MEPYLTLVALAFLIVSVFVGGVSFLRRQNLVPVIGWDADTDDWVLKKCRKTKNGILWRDRASGNILITPSAKDTVRINGSPGYVVDTRDGQGRPVRFNNDLDALGLDGRRLWHTVFSAGLKDVAESSKTDLNKTLMIVMVGGGVLLLAVLGAVVYAIQLLQGRGVPA